jgi:anti-sigma factor RsiW
MSHDHEAVRLVVASLDFELTPNERARMEKGLASCGECAGIAASHAEVQRLLGRLPVYEASQIVRQRVMRASLAPPRSRQWQVLLVAAALFGLLLAAGAAAIGAARIDPLDLLAGLPPATPQTPGELVSPTPSSAVPDPASGPSAPPGALALSDATAGEGLLLAAVPPEFLAECVRSRTRSSDPDIEGDVAGIDCPLDDRDVTESRYFLFASPSQLASWWERGTKDMDLQPDSGGCLDGSEGETTFQGGRIQCFLAPGGARLRWFDEARRIYGVVVSGSRDLGGTVEWWARTHGIAGIRGDPAFTPVEQALVDEGPADIAADCIPYRIVGKSATHVEGSVGAIDCVPQSSRVIDVGYFRFPTVAALDGWWSGRLPGFPMAADSGGCLDGTPGETTTSRGRIACYVSDGEARIRWIDRERLVYGALNGTTSDLPGLVDWWDDYHDG